MSQRQAFCENCGRPLGPRAQFCAGCGRPVATVAPPVPVPPPPVAAYSGTGPADGQDGPADQDPTAGKRASRKKKKKDKRRGGVFTRILFFLIAVPLIVFGLRVPILAVAGSSATATVTEIEQDRVRSNNRTRIEYSANYKFNAAGKSYNGSYRLGIDAKNMPLRGSTLDVKYLSVLPNMNIPEKQMTSDWYGLLAVGVGALLMFGAIKGV